MTRAPVNFHQRAREFLAQGLGPEQTRKRLVVLGADYSLAKHATQRALAKPNVNYHSPKGSTPRELVSATVAAETMTALNAAAKRRNIKGSRLVALILDAVASDGIIDAVLDDEAAK